MAETPLDWNPAVQDLRGRTGAGLVDCAKALRWVLSHFGDADVGAAEVYIKYQYAVVNIRSDRHQWLKEQVAAYRARRAP